MEIYWRWTLTKCLLTAVMSLCLSSSPKVNNESNRFVWKWNEVLKWLWNSTRIQTVRCWTVDVVLFQLKRCNWTRRDISKHLTWRNKETNLFIGLFVELIHNGNGTLIYVRLRWQSQLTRRRDDSLDFMHFTCTRHWYYALLTDTMHTATKMLNMECALRHFSICILQLTWTASDMSRVRTIASVRIAGSVFWWPLKMNCIDTDTVEMARMLCGTRHNHWH